MEKKRKDRYRIALLFIFLFLLLVRLAIVNTVPYSSLSLRGPDSHFYSSHLRSMLFERDPDVRNEILYYLGTLAIDPASPTGLIPDVYAIGSAILWLPFYLVAHIWAVIINRFMGGGAIISPDGLSLPYQVSVYLANIFYSCLGILIAYGFCRKVASRRSAFLATSCLWLSSSLFFYTFLAPATSHPGSFFATTLFMYYALTGPSDTLGYWIKLGLLAGLMTLIRWQNGLFLILPALISAREYGSFLKGRDYRGAVTLLSRNAAFLLLFLAIFSLQMAVWRATWGSWLLVPQAQCKIIDIETAPGTTGYLTLIRPHIASLLFSTRNGLLTITPIFLVASFGFLPLYRKNRFLCLSLIICAILQIYIASTPSNWLTGEGAGPRRIINTTAIFMIGLACLVERLQSRVRFRYVATALALFVLWNMLHVTQIVRLEFGDEHLSFDQLVLDKLKLPYRLAISAIERSGQ